eukprot:CAMPEP_0185764398 /NCGR_PEP_ID=MMETSP1174-20130828/23322_1 /TAXON_ID=35687 /ORGANISM="Dictyocha speculum, Strain CCMP1381" /LENGTH=35 /DNA_ID= /DNA_START= /DNA_END= /DNA_ORIENTATION=
MTRMPRLREYSTILAMSASVYRSNLENAPMAASSG